MWGSPWGCGEEGFGHQLHAVPGEFLGLGPCGTHKPPAPQVETLTSLKALGRYVDSSQVTAELDGTFPYCHGEWVQFFQVSVITPSAVSSPSRGALCPRGSKHGAAFVSHGHPQESNRNACFWLRTHIHLCSLPHQPSRSVPKIFPTGLVVPLLLLLHLCLLPAASAPIPLPSQPPGPAHPAASPRRSCIPSQPASGGRRSCCRAASRSCGAPTAWRGRRYRGGCPHPSSLTAQP